MPTKSDEDFRFTDLAPILKSTYQVSPSTSSVSADWVNSLALPDAIVLVIVNGVMQPSLAKLGELPQGTYVGGLDKAPQEIISQHLGSLSQRRGGPFGVINGALAKDALCVVVPSHVHVPRPIHVINVTTGTGVAREVAAPRLLVVVGEGSKCEVVEEFVGAAADVSTLTCSTAEVVVGEEAVVAHRYVERESSPSLHTRATLVRQASRSSYTLTEARLGAALSRHDLAIQQDGPDTVTEMRHFLLVGRGQLHDLHTRLELNHPRGAANQLHKCIVSAPDGRGVFDGNVQVNQAAQQTDAGQLSRNLLLAPLATVNVKPNLQIIADDVKCTHGCTVSDLSLEELFYFRSRGISAEVARQALVASFGAEVTNHIPFKPLKDRIVADVNAALAPVMQAA